MSESQQPGGPLSWARYRPRAQLNFRHQMSLLEVSAGCVGMC